MENDSFWVFKHSELVENLYGVTQGTDTSAIFEIIHSLTETALFQKNNKKKKSWQSRKNRTKKTARFLKINWGERDIIYTYFLKRCPVLPLEPDVCS